MAGNLWGADVDQLRTLARQFSKTADLLLQQSAQLSSQINTNPAWKGEDAEHFRSNWNGNHRALLQKTAARLKQESKLLLTNAEEQDKASSTGGSSTGGSAQVSSNVPGAPFVPLGPRWMTNGDVTAGTPTTVSSATSRFPWDFGTFRNSRRGTGTKWPRCGAQASRFRH